MNFFTFVGILAVVVFVCVCAGLGIGKFWRYVLIERNVKIMELKRKVHTLDMKVSELQERVDAAEELLRENGL
jgi:outer membrane murein-binding lipoprotein Lpp